MIVTIGVLLITHFMQFVNIFLDHLKRVLLENYIQFYWHLLVLSLANFIVFLASFFQVILHGHCLKVVVIDIVSYHLAQSCKFYAFFFLDHFKQSFLWFLCNFIHSHIILHHRCLQKNWNLFKSFCMIFACELYVILLTSFHIICMIIACKLYVCLNS
jgi:hypothetical protein